jgi:two-component system LytT family sensor kinase
MKNKVVTIIAHLAGWLFFFSLVVGFVQSSPGGGVAAILASSSFIAFCIIYLLVFYGNTYLLIPQLYLKKRFIIYGLTVLLLFAAVYFIRPFDDMMNLFQEQGRGPEPRMMGDSFRDRPPPPSGVRQGPSPGERDRDQTDIVSIILFVTVWSLSTAICVVRQWRQTEQRAVQAEADKANAELSFLKAQINPHFLFNTLNNIYSLAVTGNANTAASILKLSNIMRYVTDDVREDFVSLNNEIECMGDFIDLQRLRLGKKMNVDFTVKGNTENKQIAPLMLMTFIENTFKYGVSNHEPSDITIQLTADERSITFFCRNRIVDTKRNPGRTGIGIENVKQRLHRQYPGKHFLDIQNENGLFTVQLTLQA